jgi:N-acyl-D-aspartate/D-glutamate deacylase
MYEYQPRVGRPFTWTALLATSDGRHRSLAQLHATAYANGARVHPQVSCRPLVAQTTMRAPFSLRGEWLAELDGASDDVRVAAYGDRSFRQRAAEQMAASAAPPNWARWRVVESASAELVGRRLGEIAAERSVTPWDALLDIAIDDLNTRFEVSLANDDPDEVAQLLSLDGAVLGLSDAGAHPDQICDAVLPTDFLGAWSRDRGTLGVGAAVRKLTGEPADVFGFTDRGYLRPGLAADIVVFDRDTIAPGPIRRVHDLPDGGDRLIADRPTGLRHVLVNGVAVRQDGEPVPLEAGSGRVLRSRPVTDVA